MNLKIYPDKETCKILRVKNGTNMPPNCTQRQAKHEINCATAARTLNCPKKMYL